MVMLLPAYLAEVLQKSSPRLDRCAQRHLFRNDSTGLPRINNLHAGCALAARNSLALAPVRDLSETAGTRRVRNLTSGQACVLQGGCFS
jgi:hypothetical protein